MESEPIAVSTKDLYTMIKIIECPRDAMQGIHAIIPTALKVKYINQLLKVGFDTIDFGSFVSPKAIPQLRDTSEVLESLDKSNSNSKLLAIIANERGAKEASQFSAIDFLGFPLSMSETFQQKNTNKSIFQAFEMLGDIQDICLRTNKKLVVYLSMGFGNPYNDPYNEEEVVFFVKKLAKLNVEIVSLSDTVGVAYPDLISSIFGRVVAAFPSIEFGAHLHSTPHSSVEKIEAAYVAGCRRFDGALKGFGGCPMADDDLVGNMATENLIAYLKSKGQELNYNWHALDLAFELTGDVFNHQ